ncbi:hypothetical protein [Undibacterium sp. TS12]|uniref:hypothetical protein n=1 Tax=Undibacterium sp. TS12 TaxID=2908202 RepID=UPI001F4C89FC|nr:hypothetical protein [Undibacterium sp. TS12]MCH8618214.1 hypothetical protein [Undibacterium sp. TS12]
MGGNALQAESVRLPAARYHALELSVMQRLQAAFPQRRMEAVLAYANKPDFGDMDILVEGGDGYDPAQFAHVLQATEVVHNGDVSSMGLAIEEGVFQLDLIRTPATSFDFAVRYFGLNDFGNLVGRIAHKFGAKFGHLGLLYPLRDTETGSHLIAELCITSDFSEALDLLGYDANRYEQLRTTAQFKSLEDIFHYVVSSPFANREIYLLDNRNHKARIRDAKRATYNAFLAWLDEQAEGVIPAYPWAEAGSNERDRQKQAFLENCFTRFPSFKLAYEQAMQRHERTVQVKRKFNGILVTELTGLTGKALGELMAAVRHSFTDEEAFMNFFLEANPDDIRARLLQQAVAENLALAN